MNMACLISDIGEMDLICSNKNDFFLNSVPTKYSNGKKCSFYEAPLPSSKLLIVKCICNQEC